jgi:hypothetical protein
VRKIKSQDLRAGMTVRNSLGIAVTLDHVEVFPARYIRAGWHMPACVLVFFGGNREHSHTFHFDEELELWEDKALSAPSAKLGS